MIMLDKKHHFFILDKIGINKHQGNIILSKMYTGLNLKNKCQLSDTFLETYITYRNSIGVYLTKVQIYSLPTKI